MGLVIFNPAVGGWSTGEGGQNLLMICLRGVEKIVHSFLRGVKNSLINNSKLCISFEGVKMFSFFTLGGAKKIS